MKFDSSKKISPIILTIAIMQVLFFIIIGVTIYNITNQKDPALTYDNQPAITIDNLPQTALISPPMPVAPYRAF